MINKTNINRQNNEYLKLGFSVVEIIIVVVIVAVLSLIMITSYRGVNREVAESVLRSDLETASNTLNANYLEDYSYPEDLNDALNNFGLKKSDKTSYQYSLTDGEFCITATSSVNGASAYYVTSENNKIQQGACPDHIDPNGGDWKQIAVGGSYGCRIAYNDQLYCWGSNVNGRLGNNSTVNSSNPVRVDMSGVLSGKTIKKVSAGYTSTCAIASDDKVYCWGENLYGKLGFNSLAAESIVPVAVDTSTVMNGKNIVDISVGIHHACAVDSLGDAYCWGYGATGALGNNSTTTSRFPVIVNKAGVLSGKNITSIVAAGVYTCAIASGDAYCWGQGTDGKLGDGLNTQSAVPVAVSKAGVLSGKTVTSISASGYHTCVIASDNYVYCWGQGASGQMGNGSGAGSAVPVRAGESGLLAGKSIKSIASGYYFTCAVTTEDKIYCWGSNGNGQLGNNSNTNVNSPVFVDDNGVLSSKNMSYIVCGHNSTCAIDEENNSYCWGSNVSGQLGNGNTTTSWVPVINVAS